MEKNADEQGLIRGVEHRASTQMGRHYWQTHVHSTQREGQGTAGTAARMLRSRQRLLRGLAALAGHYGGGGGEVGLGARPPCRAWCSVLFSMLLSSNQGTRNAAPRPGERAYQRGALRGVWLESGLPRRRFVTAMAGEIASGTCCIVSLARL